MIFPSHHNCPQVIDIPLPDTIQKGVDAMGDLWKEWLAFRDQFFQALQRADLTVVSLAENTRGRVMSWIDYTEHLKQHPWLKNSWITEFCLFRFNSRAFFTHITSQLPEYPIQFGNTGRFPVDIIKETLWAKEVERDIPWDIEGQVMETLRKEWKITLEGEWPIDDASRATLKTYFSSQTFRHGNRILIKVEHYPWNRIIAHMHVVKAIDEIEQEFLREGSNMTFLWVDQSRFFRSIAPKK